MKTEELDEVFSGIPELIDFHSLFLHLVQEKLAFFDDEQTIGDAFINLVIFCVVNLCLNISIFNLIIKPI